MKKTIMGAVLFFLFSVALAGAETYDEYVRQGNGAFRAGKLDDAIASYTKALEAEPNKEGRIYNLRGMLYKQQGKLDLAIKDFTKAIEIEPESAEMYLYNRGDTYGHQSNLEMAAKDFSEIIKLSPQSWEAYAGRGKAKLFMGLVVDAEKDLSKAIELNPEAGEAYKLRAIAYDKQNKKKKAKADREKAKTYGIEMKGPH